MAKSKRKTTKKIQEAEVVEPVETRARRQEDESEGRPLVRTAVVVVLVLLGLYLLLNLVSDDQQTSDQATEDAETSQVKESDEPADTGEEPVAEEPASEGQPTGTTVTETESEYSYAVGEGESYTTIARRAIASIDSGLTPAERVAAETKIVSDTNAEWLNAGQNLALSKDTVRAAVDWAKSLSDEQKAAWQPYADLVAW